MTEGAPKAQGGVAGVPTATGGEVPINPVTGKPVGGVRASPPTRRDAPSAAARDRRASQSRRLSYLTVNSARAARLTTCAALYLNR
jgi:hypothetical protein